mgnify:CR=1 FL=1
MFFVFNSLRMQFLHILSVLGVLLYLHISIRNHESGGGGGGQNKG